MVSHTAEKIEYTYMGETTMTIMINEINNQDTVNSLSFMETFSFKQGIRKFGQKRYESIYGEMLQLNQITFFKQIKVAYFNQKEREIAL